MLVCTQPIHLLAYDRASVTSLGRCSAAADTQQRALCSLEFVCGRLHAQSNTINMSVEVWYE